jgi:hypothetical protein
MTRETIFQTEKKPSSCEYFRSKGVIVAIPWSGMTAGTSFFLGDCSDYSSVKQHHALESQNVFLSVVGSPLMVLEVL